MCSWRAGSPTRAAPSWPSSWRPRATTSTYRRCDEPQWTALCLDGPPRPEAACARPARPAHLLPAQRKDPKMIEGLLTDLDVVRKDFPILARVLSDTDGIGQPLVYLDSANTSQKPQVVIDTMVDHLEHHNANIARAMHQLGAESTAAYEGARDRVAAFIGAPNRDEVVFLKNASEALNLAANTL